MLLYKTKTGKMNIIKVYVGITDKVNVEREEFCTEIEEIYRNIKQKGLTIVMGDLNVGTIGMFKAERDYGLGKKWQRGLIQKIQSRLIAWVKK